MLINTGILKVPSNWALVAFSTALLVFIMHIAITGGSPNEQG